MRDVDKYDAAVGIGLEVDLAQEAARRLAAGVEPEAEDGALRVWWIRNVPAKATYYGVPDLVEALHLYGRLVWHDLQRSDVESNVGGLEVFRDGDWEEWEPLESELTDITVNAMEEQGRWLGSFDSLFDALMDALRGEEK
jgi:hypothetical protein